MQSIAKEVRLSIRADKEWERVVFAEVLIPDVPNVFGDYWTRESVKQAAYVFMQAGFGIDVEHDNVDVQGTGAVVVESFIVRKGDPDFIEGSWVVGMRIIDDALWAGVLDGTINGYSYEALVEFFSGFITLVDDGMRRGITEPDLEDGHTHEFVVLVDMNNRPIDGGTTVTDGHAHTISTHTVTDEADGHTHRFNLVSGKDGK
jgi:hypothetical protein